MNTPSVGLYGQITNYSAPADEKSLNASIRELVTLADKCRANKTSAFIKKKQKQKKARKVAKANKKRNRK